MNDHSAALTGSDGSEEPATQSRSRDGGRRLRAEVTTGVPSATRQTRRPRRKTGCDGAAFSLNVYSETNRDNVSVMAAGVAFWTFLSIFPGLSALISIYGLIADPDRHRRAGCPTWPACCRRRPSRFSTTSWTRLTSAPRQALGLGLVVSLLLTLFYSMSGTGTLMQALAVAYEERDTRGILAYYAQVGGADDRHRRVQGC